MIRFSQEKVLLLHKLITEETGGDPSLRDIGFLDSALESAFQTFGGKELYPSKEEKAARARPSVFIYSYELIRYLR
jgi:death-on-curing protein